MAHRALTLKYRPQTFADVVGQDHVTAVLARALENERFAHAYLFTGSRGVGKTTAARILAKALNCERRTESGKASGKSRKADGASADPCNACTSCTEITSGISLDVAEIDGASNRGIADVQALREKVRFTPTGGRYRVVIIDEVHQLSNDAFAALLKTLEEPPPHLVFIFATTDPQKLPETIRSRTQRFDFARVPLRKVAARLAHIAASEAADPEGLRFDLSEGASLLIAQKSEGSLRDAVSALDQVVAAGETKIDEELVRRVLGLADSEAFFEIGEAIVARDPKRALRALHAAYEKGFDARDLAEGLSAHIRHILVLKVDPKGADLVVASAEDLARLRAQGEGWSESDLLRLMRIASDTSWPMRDSPQPMFHLEAAVMQMATLEPGELLADILARLAALEGTGRGSGGRGAAPASGRASGPATRAPGSSRTASVTAPARDAAQRASAPAGDARTIQAPAARAGTPAAPPARGAALPAHETVPARPGSSGVSASAARPATPAIAAPPAATALAELDEPALDPDTETGWRKTLESINGRKRMLGAFLEESYFLGRAGNELVIGTDDLHRSVIMDPTHVALIGEEARLAFGVVLSVRCVAHSASGPAASIHVGELEPTVAALATGEEPAAPDVAPQRPARPSASELEPMAERAIRWFDGETFSPDPPASPEPRRSRS